MPFANLTWLPARQSVDFKALIAVVFVMLGLLQQKSHGWHQSNSKHLEDMNAIRGTRDLFELSSMEQGGSIARQGVHMIDSLGAFVADGQRSDFTRTATLFAPYLGIISVQSGRDVSSARVALHEHRNSTDRSDDYRVISSQPSSRNFWEQDLAHPVSCSTLDNFPWGYTVPQSQQRGVIDFPSEPTTSITDQHLQGAISPTGREYSLPTNIPTSLPAGPSCTEAQKNLPQHSSS